VEIADHARKHGVADSDIEHVVRNAIRVLDQGDRNLYIGADRSGRLLEVLLLQTDPMVTTSLRPPKSLLDWVRDSPLPSTYVPAG